MPFETVAINSRKNGFTLLESILTMTLFVIGIVVIFHLFSLAIGADTYAENRGVALQLARERMEQVKAAAAYADIDAFAAARAPVGGGFSFFEREVTVAAEPKEVSVIVYWQERGVEHNLALTTLMADYGY